MPKAPTGGIYAVAKGFNPGIYPTWDDCEQQVKGFPGSRHKKFKSRDDAVQWLSTNGVSMDAPGTYEAKGSSSASTASTSARMDPLARPSPKPDGAQEKGKAKETAKKSSKSLLGKDVIEDTTDWQIVYSDGACRSNGKPNAVAGVGVWWGDNDPRNIAERCPGDQTNNRAELIALVRVLETTPKGEFGILIKTDSTYSIRCVKEWYPKWQKNGWRTSTGKDVSNIGIIRYFDALLQERMKAGQRVHLEYVRGHSGERGNDGADYQANRGCELPREPDRDWVKLEAEARRRIGAAPAFKVLQGGPAAVVIEPAAPASTVPPQRSSMVNEITPEELEAMRLCMTDDIAADLSD